MKSADQIYAKFGKNRIETLPDHTLYNVQAIVPMANSFYFDFDPAIACKGAVLHDLAKAHPKFQYSDKGIVSLDSRRYAFSFRHEIASLAFLPAFPREEWNLLIEMVVAHHKSIRNDRLKLGIEDIAGNDRKWIDHHLLDWEEWSIYGIEILNRLGYPCRQITREEAEGALLYALNYCKSQKYGWSPWRGVLMAADHFASAFSSKTEKQLKSLFKKPDLSFYFREDRKNDLYPLSKIPVDDPRRHTIAIASTSSGKTDFFLKRCQGRIFYVLPYQASINAMHKRFKKEMPKQDIRILYATSRITIDGKAKTPGEKCDAPEEKILQRLVGSSVKILTPHQLSSILFGTFGFESILIDIQGCDVILDEVHTYSRISQAIVLELVKMLVKFDCRIHIGTATMPTALYEQLLSILDGKENVYEVRLPDTVLDSFDRHRIYKLKDEERVPVILKRAFERKEKVLMVYNTIREAQEAYEKYHNCVKGIPVLLIHSRYRRKDRIKLEEELLNTYNVTSPCLVISTQVVEVSLDINFDLMITQCAPIDSLIQRFGRINRIRIGNKRFCSIYVIAPYGDPSPYEKKVLEDSFNQLPGNGAILRERELQKMIDSVYPPPLDITGIDMHLAYRDGEFALTKLTSRTNAVLMEAIEVESATCILEADREKYLKAGWEKRIGMEIPVSWKAITRYNAGHKHSELKQLDKGSHPFVVSMPLSRYKTYGLQLDE